MVSIVSSPEIQDVSSPEKEGSPPSPALMATPVVGRMKAPPVCRDSSLRETAMTTEELSMSTFATEESVPRTTLYNNVVSTDTPVPVSSSSSISDYSDAEKHCERSSPLTADRINAVVSLRKTSRQGRATQRWITDPDSHETIRLTTGCVPILRGGKILFVSASRKPEWILPKGGWELDETMEESAVRECFEEAGVLGVLGPKLSDIQYETRKAKKRRLQLEMEEKGKRTKLDADDELKDPSSYSNTAVLSSMSKVLEQSEAGSSKGSEETCSLASAASATYNQVRMTLFPLYVSNVAEVWPESGRFRKAVDIDEAIEMLESRPEFKKALLDVKEQGLHLRSEPQARAATL